MPVRRRVSRVAAGLLGGLLAVWLTAPAAAHAAEQSAADVEMQDEAWFFKYRQPAEQLPDEADDIEDPTGNEADAIAKATVRSATGEIYTGEFLRVGTVLGEEEARSYVTLPTTELGGGLEAIVTGGTVTLVAAPTSPEEPPEDVDPDAEDSDNAAAPDQRDVDSAAMIACLTLEFVAPDLGGDWADRPEVDCEVRSPLEPVDEPEHERPTWTVDLAPFVETWQDPAKNHGIAILPDPDSDAGAPEQSWHVAFPNRFNNLAGPPPLAHLTFRQEELPDFDDFDEGFEDDGFEDDGFDDGGGFDDEGFDDDGGFDDEGFDDGGGGFDGGGSDPPPADAFDEGEAPPIDDEFEEDLDEPQVAGDEVDDPDPTEEAAAAAGPGRDIRTHPALALLPVLGLGLAALLGYSLTREPELIGAREGAVSRLMQRRRPGGSPG